MFKLAVFAAFICVCASGFRAESQSTIKHTEVFLSFEFIDHKKVFNDWKLKHNQVYATIEEEASRFSTFVSNYRKIHKFNKHAKASYTLGLNQFAAMDAREFRHHVHGKQGSCLTKRSPPTNFYSPSKSFVNIPTSVDWTTKGVVTPVKNQGQCGSCWAFSTTGSLESRTAIKTGTLTSLSEQELVDCSGKYGNQGCQGGLMDDAFKYIKANGGLCSESEYPYTGKNGVCKASSCGTKYDPITGYTDVTTDNSPDLAAAVAAGPVSIAIEADQFAFQFYKGGVLKGRCGTKLDHGVLAVGYGVASGEKFWKVKNSWGANWGEKGYLRICRDCSKNSGSGECGILMQPSYPLV